MSSLTVTQALADLLAIAAWTPVTVCPGSMLAWGTDFYQFRDRSFVERIAAERQAAVRRGVLPPVQRKRGGAHSKDGAKNHCRDGITNRRTYI